MNAELRFASMARRILQKAYKMSLFGSALELVKHIHKRTAARCSTACEASSVTKSVTKASCVETMD